MFEAKRLWQWDSGQEINCWSRFDDVLLGVADVSGGKNVWLVVLYGDDNGDKLFVGSSFIDGGRLFKRFDCLDLTLLRSLRSSSPDEFVFNVTCWDDTDCWFEHRLLPPAPVRFVRLVLLLLRAS